MKPYLIVLCGLQCSGKSTKAKELQKEYEDASHKCIILSSDQIRKDHPEIAQDNNKVFNKLYADMNYWLRQGDNVIIDSTAITIKARSQIFHNLKEDCYKICYIMNTPYNQCEQRLIERNKDINQHHVPLDVLKRYYESFEIPFYTEGWTDIILDRIIDEKTSDENKELYLKLAQGFNQKNKHHTQDLGEHMKFVGDRLSTLTDNKILIEAGYYHDVGKLSTQTLGEDGNCHYYNHDSVGAYNLMCASSCYNIFSNYMKGITLKWLFYINYHMKLHNATTEKSIKKWKNRLGEELYDDLRLFEQADKSRP